MDIRSKADAQEYISHEDWRLMDIPKEFRTKEICMEALRKSPLSIYAVPVGAMDEELVRFAVATRPDSLQMIPEDKLNRRLVALAVREDPKSIQYAPESLINEDIVNMALSEGLWNLSLIPEQYITQSMCDDVYEEYGSYALAYIPEQFQTEKERRECPEMIHYFREQSPEVALAAIRESHSHFRDIRPENQAPKVIQAAIEKDPVCILWIDRENVNEGLLAKIDAYAKDLEKNGRIDLSKEVMEMKDTLLKRIAAGKDNRIIQPESLEFFGLSGQNACQLKVQNGIERTIASALYAAKRDSGEAYISDNSTAGYAIATMRAGRPYCNLDLLTGMRGDGFEARRMNKEIRRIYNDFLNGKDSPDKLTFLDESLYRPRTEIKRDVKVKEMTDFLSKEAYRTLEENNVDLSDLDRDLADARGFERSALENIERDSYLTFSADETCSLQVGDTLVTMQYHYDSQFLQDHGKFLDYQLADILKKAYRDSVAMDLADGIIKRNGGYLGHLPKKTGEKDPQKKEAKKGRNKTI